MGRQEEYARVGSDTTYGQQPTTMVYRVELRQLGESPRSARLFLDRDYGTMPAPPRRLRRYVASCATCRSRSTVVAYSSS